jgi:hypothetical protein
VVETFRVLGFNVYGGPIVPSERGVLAPEPGDFDVVRLWHVADVERSTVETAVRRELTPPIL